MATGMHGSAPPDKNTKKIQSGHDTCSCVPSGRQTIFHSPDKTPHSCSRIEGIHLRRGATLAYVPSVKHAAAPSPDKEQLIYSRRS